MKCAACDKTGESLKLCAACKAVRYCNATCQKKHRKDHRKECKRIAGELKAQEEATSGLESLGISVQADLDASDSDLWKSPPRPECPICMLLLPLDPGESIYMTCCGKTVCGGCDLKNQETIEKNNVGCRVNASIVETCAFCRAPSVPSSIDALLKRIEKRMELNDSQAFMSMATIYSNGEGAPKDERKEFHYILRAAELGNAEAYCHLAGHYFTTGNEGKCKEYFQLAAMGGNVDARHNIGAFELKDGRIDLAARHYRIAAGAGLERSLHCIRDLCQRGIVSKDEFAETLRTYQAAQEELKSEDRDKYAALRAKKDEKTTRTRW